MEGREVIVTDAAAPPGGAFSLATATSGLVFAAGQVGVDPVSRELGSDLPSQVRTAIGNLEKVLIAAGSGLDQVLKTTCFLTDIENFAEFDAVYRSLMPEPHPARSTFGVQLAGDLLFEIEAVALRRGGVDG